MFKPPKSEFLSLFSFIIHYHFILLFDKHEGNGLNWVEISILRINKRSNNISVATIWKGGVIMGDISRKAYSGYKSYQYLERGVDFFDIEPDKEIGRVEQYLVPLTSQEEKRVKQLYKKCVVIALHDHAFSLPRDMSRFKDWGQQGRSGTAYAGLAASCIDAVFDNLMDGFALITSKASWQFDDVVCDLGMRLSDIAHQDLVVRGERVRDIIRAHDEGKIAFIPSIECATPIEQEIDRIDVLYGLGIRMMGIAYSQSNLLGSGLKEDRDAGLTHFGRDAVKRMNKIGMAIDVAHSSMKTALDVVRTSEKPVFISHAGAKAIWNSKRMFSDEVIRACAERGGVIGIEASPGTTFSRKHPQMDIETVMDHFEYCASLVGLDHVAFGLDTQYGDHIGLHRAASGIGIEAIIYDEETKEQPTKVAYVKGMENPTEGYNNIVRWLVKHDYSDDEIAKVVGGNTLRVLEEVW
jgi:membrane dipeptidase